MCVLRCGVATRCNFRTIRVGLCLRVVMVRLLAIRTNGCIDESVRGTHTIRGCRFGGIGSIAIQLNEVMYTTYQTWSYCSLPPLYVDVRLPLISSMLPRPLPARQCTYEAILLASPRSGMFGCTAVAIGLPVFVSWQRRCGRVTRPVPVAQAEFCTTVSLKNSCNSLCDDDQTQSHTLNNSSTPGFK